MYRRLFIGLLLISACVAPGTADAGRLWTSGFELQTTTAGEEWTASAGSPSISTSIMRSGAASLRCNPTASTGSISQFFSTSGLGTGSAYFRFYVYIASAPSSQTDIFQIESATNGGVLLMVKMNTNRTLELHEIGTGQADTDSAALALATWYRIEVSYVVDTWTLKIDGTTVADVTNASFDNADIDEINLGCITSTTADLYFDDVAINDTSGSAQTSYPGNGSVVYALPNGQGDNDPSACLNTSAAACAGGTIAGAYQEIDETDPDDVTSFIDIDDSAVIGDFVMQNSSTIGIDSYDTITLVDIGYRAREETSTATLFRTRVKSASGGTVDSGTAVDLGSTTWRTNANAGNNNMRNRHVSYTDPTTGIAWTPTGTNSIDSMQVGATITNTADVDVSTLWAMIEYVDGNPPAVAERMRALLQNARIKVSGGRFKLQSN